MRLYPERTISMRGEKHYVAIFYMKKENQALAGRAAARTGRRQRNQRRWAQGNSSGSADLRQMGKLTLYGPDRIAG